MQSINPEIERSDDVVVWIWQLWIIFLAEKSLLQRFLRLLKLDVQMPVQTFACFFELRQQSKWFVAVWIVAKVWTGGSLEFRRVFLMLMSRLVEKIVELFQPRRVGMQSIDDQSTSYSRLSRHVSLQKGGTCVRVYFVFPLSYIVGW